VTRKPANSMSRYVDDLSHIEALRRPATWIVELGAGPPRRWARRLEQRLGHPAHPALTDLPIGFWTSSLVLDLVGGRRGVRASRRLVALGVVTAVPTAIVGLGDAAALSNERRRVAVVHAVCNVAATAVYVMSWSARRDDRRVAGAVLGLVGACVATVGGLLGGHLAFRADELGVTPEPEEVVDPTAGVLTEDLSEQLIDVELKRRRSVQARAEHPSNGAHVEGL
jgi:uncharacterized membrane protein